MEELVGNLGDVDKEIHILFKASSRIWWLSYYPTMRQGTFKRVNMGSDSGHLILQSPTEPNVFLNIDQEIFLANLMAVTYVHTMMAVGPFNLTRVKGLLNSIYPTRPPKNFQDAMQLEDVRWNGQRHSTRNIWDSSNTACLSWFRFRRG
jgi:hypothetical protein